MNDMETKLSELQTKLRELEIKIMEHQAQTDRLISQIMDKQKDLNGPL